MSFAILGMGTAVPDTETTQEESLKCAQVVCCQTEEHVRWLSLIYAGAGIRKRHWVIPREAVDDVLDGTQRSGSMWVPTNGDAASGPTTAQRLGVFRDEAGPLGVAAARQAIEQSGLPASAITHVVTVTCTGFTAPGIDLALVEGLSLSATVQRTQVGFMGCHGALNGLRVASAFAGADPAAVVLVCAVELCSMHYQYGWDPQRMVANAIFADGAAAVVGVAADRADRHSWRVRANGSCLIPNSAKAMGWIIGDHGFEMTLSPGVPQTIGQNLRPWFVSWLAQHGLTMEQVGSWAIHPGGPRILEAVEECLGLSREQTADARTVFAEHGNMSSPTLLFILDRLRRRQSPRPCVALGFGPGLWAEAALLD